MKIQGSPKDAEAKVYRRIQALIEKLDKMKKVHRKEEGQIEKTIAESHEEIQMIRSLPKEDFDYRKID